MGTLPFLFIESRGVIMFLKENSFRAACVQSSKAYLKFETNRGKRDSQVEV
jgi:hypothetical protein